MSKQITTKMRDYAINLLDCLYSLRYREGYTVANIERWLDREEWLK